MSSPRIAAQPPATPVAEITTITVESFTVDQIEAAGDLVFTSVITSLAGSDPNWPRDVASLRILDGAPGTLWAKEG